MKTVYLDNNATTRTDPAVVEAMLPFFSETFGNPSSGHAPGKRAAEALKAARREVAALLGASMDAEIIFTSGGTESNTTAILSALAVMNGRKEIVTSAVEHPAILACLERLKQSQTVLVHRVSVDRSGQLDLDHYRSVLSKRTALVTMMWANNETGTLFPVAELAKPAKAVGALFHTDAVQAVGKLPIALKDNAIDMLSLSAHKFHGPKGIGALYLRKGTPFVPLLTGGHQERRRRAGTENMPAIVGLGVAARLAAARLATTDRITVLRDRLEQGLTSAITGSAVLGHPSKRTAGTLNIAFDGADAEGIVAMLDRQGFACSTGAACSSGSMEPSHVLQAMGIPAGLAKGAIRLSLSHETTARDIDALIAVLPDIVAAMRPATFAPASSMTLRAG